MTNWFVQQDGTREDLGPLRPSELLEKVRRGEVTRSSRVRKDDSAWFSADQVGGLFEAAMRPTIEYFCPHCKVEISEPPTVCNRCGSDVQKAVARITENAITSSSNPSVTGQAGQSVMNWLNKKRLGKDDSKRPK